MVLSQASIEGLRCWRAVLLAGTSALGLQAVAPQASAQPAPPGLYVTLEGGAACGIGGGSTISSGVQIGTVFPPLASTTIGDDLCGWMGRAGISQYKPGMLGGLLDSWGFFWREQTPSGNVHARGDIDSTGRYRNAFSADAREHRSDRKSVV